MKYEKPPTTIAEQIAKLKERGLHIEDEKRAAKYLTTIGYYRLTGYMYHLQLPDGSHKFKEGVSFSDIINTYNFDKELRHLFGAYIERIEIAMRTIMTNIYCTKYGDFFWYTNRDYYQKIIPPDYIREAVDRGEREMPRKYMDTHQYIMDEITENYNDSTELFITKFKAKYTSESLPPCNMAMQILSMGKISRLYEALKNSSEKQEVANAFKLPHSILSSWLIYLTNIRNICAHHGRLWNRRTTADRFIIPSRKEFKFKGDISEYFNTTLYGTLTITIKLLNAINPDNSFLQKFDALIKKYPKIQMVYMGFPSNWEQSPAWS